MLLVGMILFQRNIIYCYFSIGRFLTFDSMNTRFLFLALGTFFLFSCQKTIEWPDVTLPGTVTGSGNSNPKLLGVWKFKGMKQESKSTLTYTEAGIFHKNETILKFISINNGGTIEFSDKVTSSKNLTYEVDTTSLFLAYENNVPVDTLELPVSYVVAPSSSSNTYTLGANNTMIYPPNPATGEPSRTMTYEFVGSKLFLRYTLKENSTRVEMGITVTTSMNANFEIVLEK